MWWAIAAGVIFLCALISFWRPVQAVTREAKFSHARKSFHTERERLEAKFITLASSRAKPDAPRWSDCTFADDVSYVRNRGTGELSAFVAVSIAMEDPNSSAFNSGDAVGNLQLGTAVFRFDRNHWKTDGRAILNLSPSEAIRFFHKELEIVGEEFAHRA
ncbi:MAG TPA: hypothetical protein VIH42_14640 [Thermoguttaceae bacterium]